MIIGLAQINVFWEDMNKNMNKVEEFIKRAAKRKVQLILFPEMTLTGFTMDINKLLDSEDIIIKWLRNLAINSNINIGIGFAIKDNKKGKNKYIFISKEGNVLLEYIKIHPFSYAGEDINFYKGNIISSCKIEEYKIAPFICYDLRFPEIFQIASKQAEIITVAANWPKSRENHWLTLLKARAIENQCYIIGINRVGESDGLEYNGASIFVDPNGGILNEIMCKEELIVRELSLEKINEIRNKFNIKNDRREDIYKLYL